MPWCAVPGCSLHHLAASIGVPFHRFPRSDELRRQWIIKIRNPNIKLNMKWANLKSSNICGKHFTPSDYEEDVKHNMAPHLYKKNVLLKKTAIPSIFSFPTGTNGCEKVSPSYKCDVCGKTFSRSHHLEAHIRSHTGEKPFKCDVCCKDFNWISSLKRHIMIHTRKKVFKCDICSKSYRDGRCLKAHVIIHTEEKPHSCGVCGKVFYKKHGLQYHIIIHSVEYLLYKCDVCGEAFHQSLSLQNHKNIHFRVKLLYKCGVYGGKNNVQNNLLAHKETRKSTECLNYPCGVCGKIYKDTYSLQRHQNSHKDLV